MNLYISTITILGLYFLGVLLVLLVGGLIARNDLYRRLARKRGKDYPRSRIIEDLRPVHETMMDFIDASPPSRELLRQLAEAEGPIRVRKLLRSVPKTESTWTAFFLIAVAGLVRFGPQGVLITDVGRQIQARMNGNNANLQRSHRGPVVVEKAPGAESQGGTNDGTLDAQAVPGAFDRRKPTAFSEPARLIRSFKPGYLQWQPAVFSADDSHSKSAAKNNSRVLVTAADHRELTDAIVAARKLAVHQGATRELQEKLANAVILPVGHIAPDVITLYSRAELLDLKANEQVNLILVFPIDSNVEQGRISVFHPLGMAMLGRRVGERFDWTVPYDVKQFEVRAVDFQPEAALAKAA
jgi:regulator of nucleoside diphosphate kinase